MLNSFLFVSSSWLAVCFLFNRFFNRWNKFFQHWRLCSSSAGSVELKVSFWSHLSPVRWSEPDLDQLFYFYFSVRKKNPRLNIWNQCSPLVLKGLSILTTKLLIYLYSLSFNTCKSFSTFLKKTYKSSLSCHCCTSALQASPDHFFFSFSAAVTFLNVEFFIFQMS